MQYPIMETHGGKPSLRFQRPNWPVKRFTATTEGEVEALWAAELADYERAQFAPQASGTVDDLVKLYITEKVEPRLCEPHSLRREKNRLKHLARECGFGAKQVRAVTPDNIEGFMERRTSEVGASTAAKSLILIRHLFKWATITKSVRTKFGLDRSHPNPAAGLKAQKFDIARSRVMTPQEWQRLKPLVYANDWVVGSMIEWARESGCRRSEMTKLKSAISERRHLSCRRPRTARGKNAP
jgi:site-specific recombinase XerD